MAIGKTRRIPGGPFINWTGVLQFYTGLGKCISSSFSMRDTQIAVGINGKGVCK